MAHPDTTELIRQLITGDRAVANGLLRRAKTSTEPLALVVAAIAHPAETGLLVRALRIASSTRDRQVIAIASAFLAGESDRVDALAREHLVDNPDSVLVAWLASSAPPRAEAQPPIRLQHRHQEKP
jgi:hypothetical protein